MEMKPFILGVATYIPGLRELVLKYRGKQGATHSARYCYSVWLRHLSMAYSSSFSTKLDVVAELGPGPSLGTGLAALLSGASRYYGLDIVPHANVEGNLAVLDELVDLFKRREQIPGEDEFPALKPLLESYEFPSHILPENYLDKTLSPKRIEWLRGEIQNTAHESNEKGDIAYFAPWHSSQVVRNKSVDMIFSQAVLEHVDNLEHTYTALHHWLKADGYMSHQIDFKSHGTAREWNGHWKYSDSTWEWFVRGKRPFLINREPLSTHLKIMDKAGFRIVYAIKNYQSSGIQREKLVAKFQYLTDDDLNTSGVFIQSTKK